MISNTQFTRCASFIGAVVQRKDSVSTIIHKPSITISRQAGARGITIGCLLQKVLNERCADRDWTLFDKNLIKKVLEDNHLPGQLENHMPEDKVNELQSLIGEIIGLHPPHWELFEKTSKTIVRLLHQGHAIVVGRGASILAPDRRWTLNVRLVGSDKCRIRHLMTSRNLSLEKASEYVVEHDATRQAYMKSYFNEDVDNPLLYDLIINTDRMKDEVVARIIIEALASKQAS